MLPSVPSAPHLLKKLWAEFGFDPSPSQRAAILHTDGPLFLPAGPGSGKTRVLLWRTVNLIAVHNVAPEEIFLSTFTEKAALQLRNGLHTLLSRVSDITGTPYDTAKLYVGTVHSLCHRLLLDRRLSAQRRRTKPPVMLDELAQFLFLRKSANWSAVLGACGAALSISDIIDAFHGRGTSRLECISLLLSFFNRLSEEMVDPVAARKRTKDATLKALLDCYAKYLELLADQRGLRFSDLSLIQQITADHVRRNEAAGSAFRHVIIDEYQDTNPVQEEIFFQLARSYRNLCVVGDDDQALYRFRGATVENFVDFPVRCQERLAAVPVRVVLGTNYRSREDIVRFYNRFIVHNSCDWRKGRNGRGFHRVMDKEIVPHRKENGIAVVASSPGSSDDVAVEIARLVKELIDAKKVEDPNQIAFLFPSLKSPHVARMRDALALVGLDVYAPRAGQFLDAPESIDIFGLCFQVFGDFEHLHPDFQNWLTRAREAGKKLAASDPHLCRFIEQKRAEVKQAAEDHKALERRLKQKKWSPQETYNPDVMTAVLATAPGISERTRRLLSSGHFARFSRERISGGKPFTVHYSVTRATSLDWNVLDFLYQLAGFGHFRLMFDRAEAPSPDEGPVCNLSLISRYLRRFLDQYPFPISGESIGSGQFLRNFVNYLYVLFRRGESEYENAEDPFPKGRIPFITIHQSKGLEFPVVVLANPRKDPKLQRIEEMVAPLLTRAGEPLDRMPVFDVMRMFYVALSRAKNLLILAHFHGQGQRLFEPFREFLGGTFPRIPQFDVSSVPATKIEQQELPESYSYTGDFLLYRRCPRQYMLFRKYGFAPSRSQTMFFGSLVHQTIEDLHQRLIFDRANVV